MPEHPLDLPALPHFRPDVLIRLRIPLRFQVFGIPLNLFPHSQGQVSKQDRLRERHRVFKVRQAKRPPLAGFDPFLVGIAPNPREGWRRLVEILEILISKFSKKYLIPSQ